MSLTFSCRLVNMLRYCEPPLLKAVCTVQRNMVGLGYSTWVRRVVSTNIMHFNEFEYHFACSRKDVHLCFIMSPGKMIFAVL